MFVRQIVGSRTEATKKSPIKKSLQSSGPSEYRGGRLPTGSTECSELREPPNVHGVPHTSGQALDPETRFYFEKRLGYDFSRVRVHSDEEAAEMARLEQARSYTQGCDIVFGAGEFSPRTANLQQTAGNRSGTELLNTRIQRKPSVSEPRDAYEREADCVAGEILRSDAPEAAGPQSTVTTRPNDGLEIDAATRETERGGAPLSDNLRAFFERRFGRDLGPVRLHTDAQAGVAARAVEARAYTLGSDIVFGAGEFAPESRRGKDLLAHELVHVIQQRADGGSLTSGCHGPGSDAHRSEVSGVPAFISSAPSSIQRVPMSDEEIAKADPAKLEARLRENEKEFQEYRPGIQPREGYDQLQHERDALIDALRKAPTATNTPPGQSPTYIQTMANDELFKALNDPTYKAEVRLLEAELQERRSVYEARLRDVLPEWARNMEAEFDKSRPKPSSQAGHHVEKLSFEAYEGVGFRLFAHGYTYNPMAIGIAPTVAKNYWKIGIGLLNFVTGESKPESYVQHRSGEVESEDLGPIDYILMIFGAIGLVRMLGRMALRPILRGARRIFTTAAERAVAEEVRGAIKAEAGAPKGLPTAPRAPVPEAPRVSPATPKPPAPAPKAMEAPKAAEAPKSAEAPKAAEQPKTAEQPKMTEQPAAGGPPQQKPTAAFEKKAAELRQEREALLKKQRELYEERQSPSGRDEPNKGSIDREREQIGDRIKKIELEERALDEELHPEKYPKSSTAKGDIGELKGHEKMQQLGYKKIGSSKEPGSSNEPVEGKPQGLDGVYENPTGQPKNVVGEAKYGKGDLRPEQKTEAWVDERLDQAVGKPRADKMRRDGYEVWKLHFEPATGTVTPTKILTVSPRPWND